MASFDTVPFGTVFSMICAQLPDGTNVVLQADADGNILVSDPRQLAVAGTAATGTLSSANAQALTDTDTPCYGVIVRRDSAGTNTGTIRVGRDAATPIDMEALATNYEGVFYPCANANAVYVKGTDSDTFIWWPLVSR